MNDSSPKTEIEKAVTQLKPLPRHFPVQKANGGGTTPVTDRHIGRAGESADTLELFYRARPWSQQGGCYTRERDAL